jgi:hypothetical protein
MSEYKFSCPHCQQHFQCDEQYSGREIQCPRCNVMIRIPPIPGKTAQYQPESGKTWATFIAPGNVDTPKGVKLERKEPPPKPPAG